MTNGLVMARAAIEFVERSARDTKRRRRRTRRPDEGYLAALAQGRRLASTPAECGHYVGCGADMREAIAGDI
ncbi:MAG: hypothetical protein JO179_23365 [Solirubrobacterales bacterium]|nr:hypothetical protein [Solirubrobacterales bacterium]